MKRKTNQRDLHALGRAYLKTQSIADLYQVVADGSKFGIARQGKIIIHGMGGEEARETAAILNDVLNEKQEAESSMAS